MNPRIVVLTVGAALTLTACTGKDHLPSWDDVESGHPKGATNPPSPYLVVTPDGAHCYKAWRPGMLAPTPETSDRVDACTVPADCGTEIECPQPQAQDLVNASRPQPVEPIHTMNPPPQMPPPAVLPTWDEVGSGHPEGATNPPSPYLIVTPEGAHCYKNWRGGMLPPTPATSDHVAECGPGTDCGTEVQCDDRAKAVLAAQKGPK